MTGRRKSQTITIEQGKRSAWLFGPVRIISPAIRAVGCPCQWDHLKHAMSVSVQRAPDVEAYLTHAGYRVDLRMVGG